MKQAILDKRISGFIQRKNEQFPDLDRSVAEITRELEAEERATNLIHSALEPRIRVRGLQYAS